MKLSEWIECQAMIVAFWPHARQLTLEQIELQHALVAELDVETARRTITAAAQAGDKFPPAPGEIVAAAREQAHSVPTFAEAYRLIWGRRGLLSRDCDPDTIHPLVRSFAVRQGIERLRMLPVDDPDYGELRRKELEAQWDRHVEAMEGRERQVLALPSAERGQGLRKLDPLSALGVSGPRELEAGDTA